MMEEPTALGRAYLEKEAALGQRFLQTAESFIRTIDPNLGVELLGNGKIIGFYYLDPTGERVSQLSWTDGFGDLASRSDKEIEEFFSKTFPERSAQVFKAKKGKFDAQLERNRRNGAVKKS